MLTLTPSSRELTEKQKTYGNFTQENGNSAHRQSLSEWDK
jgi:hypothetical protein